MFADHRLLFPHPHLPRQVAVGVGPRAASARLNGSTASDRLDRANHDRDDVADSLAGARCGSAVHARAYFEMANEGVSDVGPDSYCWCDGWSQTVIH